MSDALAETLSADLRCDARAASQLAALARTRLPGITGATEDSDEDLGQRLRDPRVFGEFVASLLDERGLAERIRTVLAEHAFDLLPLPRGEGDIILVEGRAPRSLLSIARYLAERGGLTVLHAMHLVFAVFLDRSIVATADRPVRSAVLRDLLALPEASVGLRSLYAAMHLASVPEPEAYREMRGILRANVDQAVKATLARAAMAEDGGVGSFLRIAREEGLVPVDWTDATAPEVVANIPRLPSRLGALGRRSLA